MSNYISVGITASEAAARLGTPSGSSETITWSGSGTTPTEKKKEDASWTDAAKMILENYYRGKISKQDMEAQQRALAAQRQQQQGMGQYMPFLMIGGAVLLVILLMRR